MFRTGRAIILAILVLPAYCQDSPMFRGNMSHTGIYETTGPQKFTEVKWKFQTGGRVIGTPALVNGSLYVGSIDQNMYSLDAETGKVNWSFKTRGTIQSSPAVAGGAVFFGSYDGNFYAVDAATGKKKWEFRTLGERRFAAPHLHGIEPEFETMPDFWDFYLSSPVVWEGAVYFGSGDGHVYALNAASGELKWKFKTGNVVHASPAIADGVLFIGSFDTTFYALDATTGKEKWRFKTGEDHQIHNHEGITSSAALMDGIVFFGGRDTHLYALDAKTGEKKWARRSVEGGWISVSPAVRQGKVYYATGSDHRINILDAQSGKDIFSEKIDSPAFGSPAIAGNVMYLGTFDDKLRAYDLETNKLLWVFRTSPDKESITAKLPEASVKYFYDDSVARMVRRFESGVFISSPVVAKDVVFIASTNGIVYALR